MYMTTMKLKILKENPRKTPKYAFVVQCYGLTQGSKTSYSDSVGINVEIALKTCGILYLQVRF